MKIIKIDLENITKKNIEEISAAFLLNKTIVYPTDTVYGLGCIATSEKAVKKIYKIKKRNKKLPLIILVKSLCMTKKYAKVSKKQDKYLRTVWPSRGGPEKVFKESVKTPKTIILESRGLLGVDTLGVDNSIALRLPNNDFLSTILKKIDLPIVSTSLNISGESAIVNIDDIERKFKDLKPDLIIDAGRLKRKKSSSIIDIRGIDKIKKIR